MKTSTQIALVLSIVSVIIVCLFGISVYYFFNKYSYEDFYKRLETRVRIASQYNLSPDTLNAGKLLELRKQHLEELHNETEYIIKILPGSAPADIASQHGLPEDFVGTVWTNGRARGKNGSTFYAGSRYNGTDSQYVVVVSAESYFATHHQIFLRDMLLASVAILIFVTFSLSVYFSRHFFDPIKKITDRVKEISTENIHLRLDDKNRSNEIRALVQTFNDLLNRIETAFETQKNFISNASHELGTPLTAIMGEADVSLLKPRTTEEYQSALQNISAQAERLDQITKSLLFLAQTGYKGNAIIFERLRIDEIVWETKGLIDKLNPGNKIFIDLSLLPDDPKKLKVRANKQLLQLALANIFNNACKYSGNKPVTVFIASSNQQAIITVRDQGIGIPENEMPYIYDPFFRASNTGPFAGYGIGLPLSRNVVHLHKGVLIVTSDVNSGTTVQIKIPLFDTNF